MKCVAGSTSPIHCAHAGEQGDQRRIAEEGQR
jgi:hypothetical protein